MAERSTEQIAYELLRCALAWDPKACLIGNVTAKEVARVAVQHITSCPACGAEPWVNIDCDVCLSCSALESEGVDG